MYLYWNVKLFKYKIHIYTHAIYMCTIYYIYLKYICKCVYIYLFLTHQFPSWYVKVDLYPQLQGPLCGGVGVNALPLSMD